MENKFTGVLIVGAGPAGLTAALDARKAGFTVRVLEKDPDYVGGISRTVRWRGYRFDIGGHRFFSKNDEIMRWWKQRLPDDFVRVKRLSRIFYRGRYFDYPLKAWNALSNLGLFTSFLCIASYGWVRIFPIEPEHSFEEWVSNRFGRRLFNIFFKTYTEKVWGIPTSELSADWAAQRIKGLSLSKAIINAFRGASGQKDAQVIKTLIDTFDYPKLGPGQMWEKTTTEFISAGGKIEMGANVTRLLHRNGAVSSVEATDRTGVTSLFQADQFIVSMPLRETVLAFDPPLAAEAVAAARRLTYRDFITVALVVEGDNPFSDNWIYVHEPKVKLGRIQNFKNWSEAMIGTPGTTCLGLEYFCFEGDGLWTMADEELVALGKRELTQLGLAKPEQIKDGTVVRVEKAYPVYDPGYQANVDIIRAALASFTNLQPVGRNGLHKYNNQDHSMMTSILAVKNLSGGKFDLWQVNSDAEYHEEVRQGEDVTGRLAPHRLPAKSSP
jgi:protoporphyrinogen oxidase